MKNTVIRVISAFMAASVLLVTCSCGKTAGKKTEGPAQPDIKNSTAVIEYTSVDKDGKETEKSTVTKLEIPDMNTPVLGLTLEEKFEKKDAQKQFEKNIESYNIDKKEYEKIIEEKEDWQTFTYCIFVTNPLAKRIAFQFVTHKNIDGVILCDDLGCEYGMGSGYGMTIALDGMVNKAKFKDEAALKEALGKMDVKLLYTFVASMDETVDDWSKVETKELKIDFSK